MVDLMEVVDVSKWVRFAWMLIIIPVGVFINVRAFLKLHKVKNVAASTVKFQFNLSLMMLQVP